MKMSDLIDRQDAIDVLEILADKMSNEGQTVMAQAIAMLKDLHSAEPERKKGEWKKIGHWGRHYRCNQCGNTLDFNGINAGRGDANFCPNCDADMRG